MDRSNPIFEEYLSQIIAFVSEDTQSTVKCLGLVLYRFCMIFTTIRKYQSQELAIDIQFLDKYFEITIALST